MENRSNKDSVSFENPLGSARASKRSPSARLRAYGSAQISPRFLVAVLACSVAFLLLPFLLLAAPVPTGKPATYPDWWFVREVVVTNIGSVNNPPVWPGDYPEADHYSVLNQGQLKNLATKACDEMESKLPAATWTSTAGIALTNLVRSWTNLTAGDNYAAINHGQLKAVTAKFYDVLTQEGYIAGINLPPTTWTTGAYPWTSSSSDDDNYAVAIAGQAKSLFSFDLEYSQDGDSLPDWWENANGLDVTDNDQNNNGVEDGLDDFDGDGVVNATEFADETQPLNAASVTSPPGSETDVAAQNGLVIHTPLQ